MHFDAWSIVRKHWESSRRERHSQGDDFHCEKTIRAFQKRKRVQNTLREMTSTLKKLLERGSKTLSKRLIPLWERFRREKGSKTLSAGERGRKVSQGMATCCAKGNQGSKEMRSQSEEGGVKDGRKDYGARNTFLLVNIRKYISYMRILFGSGLFSLILWRRRWWLWWWRCGWRSIIRACLIDCNGLISCRWRWWWWWRWWWRCGWRSIIRACLIDCNGHKRCWWWRGGGYQLDILPVMPTVSTNNAIRRYNTIITIKQQQHQHQQQYQQ